MNLQSKHLIGITSEHVRERLSYSPSTGIFRWKTNRKSRLVGEIAGTNAGTAIKIHIAGRVYMAHRLAWLYMTGSFPEDLIDHINLNPLDNRWMNLRRADKRQNAQNCGVRADNKSGFKGVCWDKRVGKWRADIRLSDARKHLGMFEDPKEASEAYVMAAIKYFGEYGRST
ncbi:TPA: HNH endonuclease [Yersinia enterocolitica]|nr:HNH endonuclease [Yersinia enterocolitica]HED0388339.1 HNH endonuclease [Yersinia enterocolitica]HEI6725104.1 HNH endonuclease [Yersinia enterocolitica]HEI6761432.1 HNH endonuclease [Yersinia enterocolitica]HEI6827339.1 HNH endonuclease [Yersinia enterocolitica]